jgi:hypothetical protein
MSRKSRSGARRKAGRETRKALEWTFLEKVLGVLLAIMTVLAAYAFLTVEETVEVESIETYAGTVDLRANDANASEYSFSRELKVDYQVVASYVVVEVGPLVHFKVWNGTTGQTLIPETTLGQFERRVRIDSEDVGVYEFLWWVEGGTGRARVDIDVLIQPTERIFEKKT